MSERLFTNEVIALARDHNWTVFHLHDQDSYENYRKIATGSGFPDLIMHRAINRGQASMVVAELKVDSDYSSVKPHQEEWLNAYRQFIPTFVWRPSDWDEIERVLRDGPSIDSAAQTAESPTWTKSDGNVLPTYLATRVNNLRDDIREQEFSPGHRAELRRMDPNVPSAAVFWRLYTRRNLSKVGGADAERKWATILQGISIMSEHDRGRPTRFGRALFSGGDPDRTMPFYSENRLRQLLAARGPTLRTLLRRAFRMLVGTEQAISWTQVAELVLNDGYNESEAERVRNEIAYSYYTAQAMAKARTKDQES